MQHVAMRDKLWPQDWRVEAIDENSGDIFVTCFSGPDAEKRAKEYAAFKQQDDRTIVWLAAAGLLWIIAMAFIRHFLKLGE